jgi:hypothetical protein
MGVVVSVPGCPCLELQAYLIVWKLFINHKFRRLRGRIHFKQFKIYFNSSYVSMCTFLPSRSVCNLNKAEERKTEPAALLGFGHYGKYSYDVEACNSHTRLLKWKTKKKDICTLFFIQVSQAFIVLGQFQLHQNFQRIHEFDIFCLCSFWKGVVGRTKCEVSNVNISWRYKFYCLRFETVNMVHRDIGFSDFVHRPDFS